jgi:type IV secretion system protein VirD4
LGDKDTPQEKKNLPQVYDLLCQDDAELKDLFRQIKERPEICYGTASRLAATVLATTEREISGALNSAREELRFIDSPIMRELTDKSTVNLHNVIENKADLYICVPSEAMEYQGRAVRFLISTIFLLLRKRKTRPKVPLLMVLDEMPLLGRISTIEKALIIGRGYRLKLMCIAQTIELLSSTYPDSWKTMLATNLSVFIGASDIETGKYISERIGQRTVKYQSENKGESQQKSTFLRPNVSASKSDSTHYVARSVLTPDEVTLLGDNVVVAFIRGERPMLLRRLEYFEHQHWKEKADPNPLEEDCLL